jgi:hypothetical protein
MTSPWSGATIDTSFMYRSFARVSSH